MPTVADRFQTALNTLTSWGFKPIAREGWRTNAARRDITFAPAGIIDHHTAAWGTTDALLFKTGRTGLPAPLCHWTIYQDGTIVLGAAGYANHAGINNKLATLAVLAGGPLDAEIHPGPDTGGFSANRSTVGVEVKCPAAYNEAQRAAAVALNAALVLAFGWSKSKPPLGAHKEITRRKPSDPDDNMGKFRADVVAFIAAKEATVPPIVTPPAPAAELLIGVANCQSYDGDTSAAAWAARGQLMKAEKRNVWLVSETTEAGRAIMLANLSKTWKTITLKGKTVAILFDAATFSWLPWRSILFGTPFGHGCVTAPLRHKASGKGVDVSAIHVRPKSVATLTQKRADVAKAEKQAHGRWPSIMGGDFAQPSPVLAGWVRATPNADTMDATGEQHVDAAFIRGLTYSNGRIVNPGRYSDHKWLAVDVAFSTIPTT